MKQNFNIVTFVGLFADRVIIAMVHNYWRCSVDLPCNSNCATSQLLNLS